MSASIPAAPSARLRLCALRASFLLAAAFVTLLLGAFAAPARAAISAEPQCTTAARQALSPTPPPEDPFYTPPSTLPRGRKGRPGTIIRSRPVCIADLEVPVPYAAWQIMYMSTGSETKHGKPSELKAVPSVDTALIIEPLVEDATGSRPLVSYQEAEDSDSTLKAPSYTLREGTSWDNAVWQPMLAQGWEIVVPDFEGPKSAYGAGPLAGHGVLDGIRAAENFSATDGLQGSATHVGLSGYSGGAQATAWASELAPRYAPELQIVGVAEGGVPGEIKEDFDTINNGILAPGLAFAVALGVNAEYPNYLPESLLNSAGLALAAKMRATGETGYPNTYPKESVSDYTNCGCNPVEEPQQFPRVAQLIPVENLGSHIPAAPLYIYHDYNDELLPIGGVERLVQKYCEGGATVDFRVYAGDEHVSNAIIGAPEAMAYLTSRFNGVAPVDTCGLPDNGGVIPPEEAVEPTPIPPNPPG